MAEEERQSAADLRAEGDANGVFSATDGNGQDRTTGYDIESIEQNDGKFRGEVTRQGTTSTSGQGYTMDNWQYRFDEKGNELEPEAGEQAGSSLAEAGIESARDLAYNTMPDFEDTPAAWQEQVGDASGHEMVQATIGELNGFFGSATADILEAVTAMPSKAQDIIVAHTAAPQGETPAESMQLLFEQLNSDLSSAEAAGLSLQLENMPESFRSHVRRLLND